MAAISEARSLIDPSLLYVVGSHLLSNLVYIHEIWANFDNSTRLWFGPVDDAGMGVGGSRKRKH